MEPTTCQAAGGQHSLFNGEKFYVNTLSSGPILKNWKLWQYWARLASEQQLASAKKWLLTSKSADNIWFTSPKVSYTWSASFLCLTVVVVYWSVQALTQAVTMVNTYECILR